jgi:hypothetical protein
MSGPCPGPSREDYERYLPRDRSWRRGDGPMLLVSIVVAILLLLPLFLAAGPH